MPLPEMKNRIPLVILAALLGAGYAVAQPVPVQQFNEQQQRRMIQPPLKSPIISTNAPELYPGENEDVGPQAILSLKQRRTHFELFLDSQYLYTDNNRLAEDDKIDTGLFINTVQFALAPTPYPLGPGQFAPRLGVRSQWYNYGIGPGSSEDVLNFNAQTIFLAGQFQYNQVWQFDAGVDYTRLVDQDEYKEFYTEFLPNVAVQRFFPLKDNLLLTLSWQGMYHITSVDPLPRRDVNDRFDNILGATLAYQPVERLVLQPFYRFQFTHYPDTALGTDRNDYFNILGVATTYYFHRMVSARMFATYTFRNTDDPFSTDYRKFDAGAGASLVWRF